MIERIEVVGYGRPAGEALASAIQRAKAGGGPLAPVTAVVPSNFAGLAARRLLGSGEVGSAAGIANVSFVTPFALAQLLAADLLLDRRPLTNPVLGAAVRMVLAEDPGPFAASAHHQATEVALAGLYAELSNVSEATTHRLVEEGGRAAGTAVRFRRAIGRLLTEFHDEADVFHAAATRADLAHALTPHGRVIWHLPAETTAPMRAFLAAVLAAAPSEAVVGLTGVAAADRVVVQTCEAVGVDLAAVDGASRPAPPTASRITSVTDADEEVRVVVREVQALAERGVRLDRVGVFFPTPDPYVRTLEQQLAAAGIPANGPSRRRLADSVAGRTLLAALQLPAQRWRRDRVMALIGGAPIRAEGKVVGAARWERLSRECGIVQDLPDWDRKVAGRIAAVARRIESLRERGLGDADGPIRFATTDVEALEAMGGFVRTLAAGVRAVEQGTGWETKARAAGALLVALLGPGGRHAGWPEEEQASFERVEAALERLATLAEIEPSPTPEVFVRALGAELDVARGRNGRFGLGVLYAPLAAAVGLDLDAVFVLGCTEGRWPSGRHEDSLLPDAARALAAGELALRRDRVHDQHRLWLAALASAPEGARVLTFPRGDLREGRTNLPSRFLLDTASALAGERVYATAFEHLGAPAVDAVGSHVAGLQGAATYASLQEHDLAELLAHVDAGGRPEAHAAATGVVRGLVAMGERRSPRLTEWDGNLAGQPIETTAERPLSPSRLETWASCGFRYFLAHLLGLAEREDPERILDLSPMDRGSAVHAALEEFFAEVIAQGPPRPDEAWTASDRERLRRVAEGVLDGVEARGVTGRAVNWKLTRSTLLGLLDQFLTIDAKVRAATGVSPSQVELPFGLDEQPPVKIELTDGRTLLFRGRADRVDASGQGHMVVYDYKTGSGSGYKDLKRSPKAPEPDPVQGGRRLQLGLYAEAAVQNLGARTAEAHYWLVDPRPGFARLGYHWTAERRERLVEVLTAIADGIEAGMFAALPGEYDSYYRTHQSCRYCPFDSVCPVDRGEQAAAKAGDPVLLVRRPLEWEVAG